MQLHWISLIVIIGLLKNLKFGLIINWLFVISFSLISSIIIFVNDLPPGYVLTNETHWKLNENSNIYYIESILISDYIADGINYSPFIKSLFCKPWPHGSVYFIGLAFGCFVNKYSQNLSKAWNIIINGVKFSKFCRRH
jgi:hypothetical protein